MPDLTLSAHFLGRYESEGGKSWEPQRQNAGYLFVPDIGKLAQGAGGVEPDVPKILGLSIETLRLPSMATEPIPVGYFNEFVSFAGKSVFDDIDLVVKDFVDVPTAKILEHWFARVYNPKIGAVGMAYTFKKDVYAVMYATDGSNMRWYKMEGAWISRISRGDIDQNASDYIRVTATLSVDRVIPSYIEQTDRGLLKNASLLPGGISPVSLQSAIDAIS